ncbi:MAG TPA: polymer-forming cytoskeletal protein [Caldisericia bacterium]|nr:polymer-forming cytoskeletal protein [Caldisericia bacterium]HPB33743.1 polymer-forming cytoskeletal protein [Caldisericia bacterium]HQL66173.1 polymer-forming cytoskeletal protein [Caldisericia bacterium]
MKKFLILILLFLIISIPNLVNAQGIVKGNGDIVIKSNEEVRGDVRLGNGNVTVYGKVFGNIIVLKGDINLKERSYVRGDVITYNGRIIMDDEAIVVGRRIEFPPEVSSENSNNLNIPPVFLSNEGLLLKIVIILLIAIFSLLFLILFEKSFINISNYFVKNILYIIPLSIIIFTLSLFIIPKEAIFPFGRSIYIIYIITLIILGFCGISVVVNKLGNYILKIFKKDLQDNIGERILSTIIGILVVFIFIILPKVGFLFLTIFASISFGITFLYLIEKIFKS